MKINNQRELQEIKDRKEQAITVCEGQRTENDD
ncbi:Conjugal transfer protein TraR [Caenorhabditis elegans]|uniref:Conjugal transfer protein TraR n=1 Tax=Caenorhabditis elegans TaxID=6239 RepID=I2HAH2_CAEEL|nr:Conjugal transfer protein TraR [Caenorhabditis elegans]CCH63900.1 Conjugal transfer protein TraR [Caenorhabditis elegans]|eukprot:NP_001263918.1 Uncharacterized protein CELE_C47A10.16 [Caenorhabditis elegans]